MNCHIKLSFCIICLTVFGGGFSRRNANVILSLAEYFKVVFCIYETETDERIAFTGIPEKIYRSKQRLLTTFSSMKEILALFETDNNLGVNTMVVLEMNSKVLSSLAQLSSSKSLSSVVWIMFSDQILHPDIFKNIYIPFNCEFIYVFEKNSSYSITEIYKIKKDSWIEKYELGSWTEEKGLTAKKGSLYERRNNLKGLTFQAIIKNDAPYVTVEKNSEGISFFKGYLFEIWKELEFRLNFKTNFPADFHDRNPQKVFQTNEVDFFIGRILNEANIHRVLDMSMPVDEAEAYMFGHRPGTELDWDSYLKPFSTNTWLVTSVWMLSSSVALSVLYKIAWDFGTSEKKESYFVYTFSKSVLTVFRAVCMQGAEVTPRSNSCRLLFLSIYLTALVVTSAFSAALFSLLTVPKPKIRFNSIDEVLKSRNHEIALPLDVHFRREVEGHKVLIDNLQKSMEKFHITPEEGLQRLCRDKFFFFVYDLPNVLYLMKNMTRSCREKILPSGPPLFTEFIGFGFKKNSPYKKIINLHIIKMKNEGILNRLFLTSRPQGIPTVQATWVRVTLSDISPILYMFASGVIAGCIVLYFEKVFQQIQKTKLNFKKNFNNKKKNALNPINFNYSPQQDICNWNSDIYRGKYWN